MKTYSHEELMQIVTLHGMWLRVESGGIKANLSYANLRYANLSGAALSGAALRGADLRGADLSGADLSGAALSYANLRYANLSGAALSGAALRGADLRGAALSGAALSGADLSGAALRGADLRGAKYGDKAILRLPICVTGCRNNIEEHWCGIRIGRESDVTSENLESLFEKHSTPPTMRVLYKQGVALIENYAREFPLLGDAL